MEPVPGRSGQQQCPSCKKIAPQFQRKVCDDCWVWFELNVDDYYHQGRRPNGRLQCPYQTGKKHLTGTCPGMASCPHCRINIFLNITGYSSPYSRRCEVCASKTILKTNKCSKCLRQQPKSTSKNRGTPNTSQKRVSFKFSKPTPLPNLHITMHYNGIPIECQPKAREQLKDGCSVVLTRLPDLLSKTAGIRTDQPAQPKSSSSKRDKPSAGTQPKISNMPGVRVTKKHFLEDSSSKNKVSKKQKLVEPVADLPYNEMEEGDGGSNEPPTGNRNSNGGPAKTSKKKKKKSDVIQVRIPMKTKKQKEEERSINKDREELSHKKKSSQEKPPVQKPSSAAIKGKELKSAKKWPEELKRSVQIQKVPLVGLTPLPTENQEQSSAKISDKPAEHPKAAANPAKLATTSTQQNGLFATPLPPPAIVQTTVNEPINAPSFKGIRKSYYPVAAKPSIVGIVPLPAIEEKSRGRCLSNKDLSDTPSGSESSSPTVETDTMTLVNAERPPQLVSRKGEYSPFESNSDSDEEPFGSPTLPEGEHDRRVPAAPVLLPLLYSTLPQMPSTLGDSAANVPPVLPEEDTLLLYLSESDEEDVELNNLITPKDEIQSNPPTPERIAPASPSSLFPRVDPVPCLGYIRNGECKKVNCRLGHSADSELLFEVAQKWLVTRDFFSVKNLIFMMATQSSPFRRSLWSDGGQELVCSIISSLLNENQADLTEIALSMMTCKDIPLKSPDICERAIEKAAPTREIADLLSALYMRLEQTGLSVPVKSWNKMLSVFVFFKRWDVTFAAVGAALKFHPDFSPIREAVDYLFEIQDKENLLKVVALLKSIQPSAFVQLPIAKREEIFKILSEPNTDQDYRRLFHLAPLTPVARQNVNPASSDSVENNTFRGFFNVTKLTLVNTRVLNTRPRPKEPMDLRVITIDD